MASRRKIIVKRGTGSSLLMAGSFSPRKSKDPLAAGSLDDAGPVLFRFALRPAQPPILETL